MITLGLNGWDDGTHDPAAALIEEGQVLAFVEQERLSRRKHAVGELPHSAIREVLALGGATASDVDQIAYGWDLAEFYRIRGRHIDLADAGLKLTGDRDLAGLPVNWVRHHDAHAASAFYGSGLRTAAVLVVDAEGEDESASIYRGDEKGLTCLRRYGRNVSLGLMFRAVSEYCGFGQFGAGKTMGLANYAPSGHPLPIHVSGGELVSPFDEESGEDEIVEGWLQLLVERFGPPGLPATPQRGGYPPLEAHRPEAAAAAQAALEIVVDHLVEEAVRLAGCHEVCLAGGVTLNCVQNGRLASSSDLGLGTIHLPPYPHDAGVALGAAQTSSLPGASWQQGARADHGTPVDGAAAYAAARRFGTPARRVSNASLEASLLLQSGKVIGWVQGRMEVGPRALGQRSILALPGKPATRDRVNSIKGREPWRPLAPSVLEEEVPMLFEHDRKSPFMLFSLPMSDHGLDRAPAAAHVDGTARLQTVAKDGSRFRALLEELSNEIGIGAVLNTSFNSRGEPIVRTAEEAIASGCRMGLDAVVIDDVVVTTADLVASQ